MPHLNLETSRSQLLFAGIRVIEFGYMVMGLSDSYCVCKQKCERHHDLHICTIVTVAASAQIAPAGKDQEVQSGLF